MKEKYLSPTILNTNSLEGNGIIPLALTKKLMSMFIASLSPNAALIVTSPPPARKIHGASQFGVMDFALTERKF